MKDPKYKVGDKVVPIAKTGGGLKLQNCIFWEEARKNGKSYLYIVRVFQPGGVVDYHCSSISNDTDGNCYMETDLIPYVEPISASVTGHEAIIEKTVLDEAKDLIYGNREKDYGKTSDNFADIAKGWEVITKTSITPEQVALMMAWLKICRANKDNCGKRDSYVDIAGYAGCIEKIKKGL